MELDWLKRNVTQGLIHLKAPDGSVEQIGRGNPAVEWQVHDPRAMKAIARDPARALPQTYIDGAWSVPAGDGQLLKLLVILMRNFPRGLEPDRREGWGRVADAAARRLRTSQPARRICDYQWDEWLARHLLGQELDHGCGYFDQPAFTLAQAQRAQASHIAAKLLIEPGQDLLEIGCGWGSLALRLAQDHDITVTGLTTYKDQFRLARHAATEQGLDDRVTFRLADYASLGDERFDRVASVGLLETLPASERVACLKAVRKALKPDGVAVIHTVGRIAAPDRPSAWVTDYAYPGTAQPALSELCAAVEHSGLVPADIEVLRLHGARTFHHWQERLQQHRSLAAERKGEALTRKWEFCLAASEAAFRYGDLAPIQFQLARRRDAVPLTRDYLYTT